MSEISDFDREAYERDKQFLWTHCAQDHDLHLLETQEFDLWLVATRTLRAEIAQQRKRINSLQLKVDVLTGQPSVVIVNERRGS